MKAAEEMTREEFNEQSLIDRIENRINAEYRKHKDLDWAKIAAIKIVHAIKDAELSLPPAEGAEQEKILTDFAEKMNTAMVNNDPEFEQIVNDHYFDLIEQPTAEGAEEILASLVESLGEPDNSIADHSYEIRPLTVEGKREWWMFHNGVGSGEPLAQWLSKFVTLHAQQIADKMVEERLREELGKFIKWYNSGYEQARKPHLIVKEYLKSREK